MNAIFRVFMVAAIFLLSACASGDPRLVSGINAAYGTSFPVSAPYRAVPGSSVSEP